MAVAPSSTALAAEMTIGLGPTSGHVIELGAGTGQVTRMLLSRGVPRANLTVVERNPVFVRALRTSFPGLRVELTQAEFLGALGVSEAEAVVSGLPLRTMGKGQQLAILAAAFGAMSGEGRFVQFTYAPTAPVCAEVVAALGLVCRRGPIVWGNLPPASIYAYQREAARGSFF